MCRKFCPILLHEFLSSELIIDQGSFDTDRTILSENSRASDSSAIKWTVEEKDILACINQIISGGSNIIGSVESLYHVSDWISVTSNNICWELFASKRLKHNG